jgi:spore coat protein JB
MEKKAKGAPSKTEAYDVSAAPVTVVTLEAAESDSISMPTPDGAMTDAPALSAAPCEGNRGTLPGKCAPLVFPYVPMQDRNPVRYSRMEALETGTLFPGLNLPFKEAIQRRTQLNNTALVELMALDFAIQELGLYLTTHAQDREALQLYWSYVQLSKEGREKYQAMYGPLMETDLTPEDGFAWLNDPWPWDLGGNA